MAATTSITHDKLIRLIGTPHCPAIVDVRIDEDFAALPALVPGSVRRKYDAVEQWAAELQGQPAIIFCHQGGGISAGAAAWLRAAGIAAETLEGGI